MSARAQADILTALGTGSVMIEWRVGGGGGAAWWTLRWALETDEAGRATARAERERDGVRETIATVGAGGVRIIHDAADGRAHVDAGDSLRATLERGEDGAWRVIYAWTSALAALGARGGEVGAPACAEKTARSCAPSRAIAG